MTQCIITKSAISDCDMEKINKFSRRNLDKSEIYTFNVTLCSNEIDRDFEKFSVNALNQMAQLFKGKTGIFDHSMRSSDQKARIFDAYVERQNGRKTLDGEDLYFLQAKAYMLNNDENSQLIQEIDAGIKKEVSVSCSMEKDICSICSSDRKKERCRHVKGKYYDGRLCYGVLSEAKDAYEFSFVAVPAQRDAGVTKSFTVKENVNMNEILKSIENCSGDVTISKSDVKKLKSYIDGLNEKAAIADEYKSALSKEVIKLFMKNFPQMDAKIVSSVAEIMTAKELIGFKKGLASATEKSPAAQLSSLSERNARREYDEFKI